MVKSTYLVQNVVNFKTEKHTYSAFPLPVVSGLGEFALYKSPYYYYYYYL